MQQRLLSSSDKVMLRHQLSFVTQEMFKTCLVEHDGTPPLKAYDMLVQHNIINLDDRQIAALKPINDFFERTVQAGDFKQNNSVDKSSWENESSSIFGGFASLFGSNDVLLDAMGEPKRDFYGTILRKNNNSAVSDDINFEGTSIWLPSQQGVYLHGGVGCGKTMIMDLMFFTFPRLWKRRTHFHAFMLDVHQRLHERRLVLKQQGQGDSDPLPDIAAEIFEESRLLCFDEFQVTDIADAMVS